MTNKTNYEKHLEGEIIKLRDVLVKKEGRTW